MFERTEEEDVLICFTKKKHPLTAFCDGLLRRRGGDHQRTSGTGVGECIWGEEIQNPRWWWWFEDDDEKDDDDEVVLSLGNRE